MSQLENNGQVNQAYLGSKNASIASIPNTVDYQQSAIDLKHISVDPQRYLDSNGNDTSIPVESLKSNEQPNRGNWSNDVEFLMSCIALSVGLGNIWRFPFTALENGGGAFVIPYIIVLFLVGKPVYYLEMLLGQFSSRGCIKVYDFAPIMRGIGYGQAFATAIVSTYYASLMALTIHYFVDSFFPVLPWSYCRPEYGSNCIDSKSDSVVQMVTNSTKTTSAEFYFTNIILRETDSIDDGIGTPNWKLVTALAGSWTFVALVMIKGIRSSGKASYFLALFPYAVMLILLIRSLTLPGAFNGVLYFLKPQWDQLLSPKVWYAAVTQVFFSLAVCFGNIIMYASYNRFGHNIHRDVTVVTTLDTFTSLISGIIIFGILGNLAHEIKSDDIQSVVKGGTGLAFISYPDAIVKFKFLPQLFSVLFFFMLLVLGIGSNVGMASCVMTVIKDQFPKIKDWIIVVGIAIFCFCVGIIYMTPGGQYVLNLVDFYGVSFVVLVLAIFELVAIGWIYGVNRFCRDVQFMLGTEISIYYRICWAVVTPLLMFAILIYTLVTYEPLQYNGYTYQNGVYAFGWCLTAFGIGQLLIWAIYAVCKQDGENYRERISNAFKPMSTWGPSDKDMWKKYQQFLLQENTHSTNKATGILQRIYNNIFG